MNDLIQNSKIPAQGWSASGGKNQILILGAKGMLGGYLNRVFSDLKPILWDKEDLDITNRGEVYKKISGLNPDVIINAAAYTAVDDCEINRELAVKVNSEAVKYLVEVMNEAKPHSVPSEASPLTPRKFIHYSTDYVFDGKNQNGYKENDKPRNPVNTYGASKLLGENYVKLLGSRFQVPGSGFYIIRTSWLYGRGGKNFVDTILKLAETRDALKIVNDQYGKPTYAYDLALRTRELLQGDYPSGIYHITNETENVNKGITWHDFAREIFVLAGKKVKVIPCCSAEYPRPAQRPQYSALVNKKLPPARNWREALREYQRNEILTQKW